VTPITTAQTWNMNREKDNLHLFGNLQMCTYSTSDSQFSSGMWTNWEGRYKCEILSCCVCLYIYKPCKISKLLRYEVYATWRSTTARPTTFHICKTRDCLCSLRLLMMGGMSPETCWASYMYGIIKFWYIVASCWIFHPKNCIGHNLNKKLNRSVHLQEKSMTEADITSLSNILTRKKKKWSWNKLPPSTNCIVHNEKNFI